ncbi:CHAD domain-containing protein [Paludibacterium denitrificans]|uniref:CHAD domain-containing protein n=1 Tax=Paludibacterium denitrificans TaxID=2675226 RepID=UPI0035E4358E
MTLPGPALSQRRKPIKNSIKHWQSLAPVERHDLRKRAKKLRYAIEFFSPLYPRQQVNAYLSALEQVQSVMGAVNDHIAGQALMKQLAQQDPELQQLV